jgi:hypothetical protein
LAAICIISIMTVINIGNSISVMPLGCAMRARNAHPGHLNTHLSPRSSRPWPARLFHAGSQQSGGNFFGKSVDWPRALPQRD